MNLGPVGILNGRLGRCKAVFKASGHGGGIKHDIFDFAPLGSPVLASYNATRLLELWETTRNHP
eukprot:scaffold15108_cov180-Amphora_coffeaeformis.AAC.88